jgi:hypothetical protein
LYLTEFDRFIKWNNNNHYRVILNVDGSCLSSPIRFGFGGIIRNTFGHYLAGFSGFIQGGYMAFCFMNSYKGLLVAKDIKIDEIVCYSDSLNRIYLIKSP